jgi:hypothetical protein
MTAGAVDSKCILVLKRERTAVRVLSEPPSIEGWRADQILFDLPTTRSQKTEAMSRKYADLLADRGPNDTEVQNLGAELAQALRIEGEGPVDQITHELLQQFIAERFKSLDPETRKLVLAKAGLIARQRQ